MLKVCRTPGPTACSKTLATCIKHNYEILRHYIFCDAYYQQENHLYIVTVQVTSLTTQLEMTISNEELRGEVGVLKTENDGLKVEVDGLKVEVDGLKVENNGYKEENAQLRAENQRLKVSRHRLI